MWQRHVSSSIWRMGGPMVMITYCRVLVKYNNLCQWTVRSGPFANLCVRNKYKKCWNDSLSPIHHQSTPVHYSPPGPAPIIQYCRSSPLAAAHAQQGQQHHMHHNTHRPTTALHQKAAHSRVSEYKHMAELTKQLTVRAPLYVRNDSYQAVELLGHWTDTARMPLSTF